MTPKEYHAAANEAWDNEDYQRAAELFIKAEECSSDGKHPQASFGKGYMFHKYLSKHDDALIAYTKAENDSSGKIFPEASFFKGLLLAKTLQRYDEALLALTKAEQDSPLGKYSIASHVKGFVFFACLNQYENALESYTKSIEDNPNGENDTAYGCLGTIYLKMHNYKAAIESYNRAIEESIDRIILSIAHYGISQAELNLNLFEKARKSIFVSVKNNSRLIQAIKLVFDKFSYDKAQKIYKNRVQYLGLQRSNHVNRHLHLNKGVDTETIFDDREKNESQFLFLLLLNTDLKLSNDQYTTNKSNRFRLAYLVAFKMKRYAYVFYIIDELLDGNYPLTDMDNFFYLYSAYWIGEPVFELESISHESAATPGSEFFKAFQQLKGQLDSAVQEQKMLDPYLLDLDFVLPDFEKVKSEIKDHWLSDCIKSILTDSQYESPIPSSELDGLVARILTQESEKELTEEIQSTSYWQNFSRNIEQSYFDSVQFDNIIKCLDERVPYQLLLFELFKAYDHSSDQINRHNIAVLQALVVLYAKGADAVSKGISTDSSKTVMSFLSEYGAKEIIGGLITFGFGASLGFTLACSFLVGKGISVITDKLSLNKGIERLREELI